MKKLKPTWQIDTGRLAESIQRTVRGARTEEDVKMALEPLLRRAFQEAGIDVNIVQYEKTTAVTSKRMDAVYGYLIIEYKGPGKLSRSPSVKSAKGQLERYLNEEAGRHGEHTEDFLQKAIGVAIDDEKILFARYSKTAKLLIPPVPVETEVLDLFPEIAVQRGFQFQGPYPITSSSLANLLVYVRSAARRPLTAADLAKVFNPETEVARVAVSELYSAAMRGQRRSAFPRVATFYAEWDRIFGVVYGEKLEKAESAAEETARLYGLPIGIRLKPLLFAIHTFYALLMKLIAVELLALQRDLAVTSFVSGVSAETDEVLRERLARLESGEDFRARGIENFLEADFFSWYLDAWNKPVAGALRNIIRALSDFEPATPVLEPDWTRDLLQKLYELVVPRMLRHSLGEYYTPDWLAGYLVDLSGYKGDPASRYLDPACGSGTFLVQAIERVVRFVEGHGKVHPAEVGRAVLDNIIGFDLNPLAVLAARTNYLIAFSRFLPYVRPISLPVYLCDSVLPPDRYEEKQRTLFDNEVVVFKTREHDYIFPVSMKNKGHIEQFTGLILRSLRGKTAAGGFRSIVAREMKLEDDEMDRLTEIYRRIKELDDQHRDGIWAHYIKNAFAPVYVGQFDFVIGNPPWIRWGYLADDYRQRTLILWRNYGLFSLSGHETRLGAGEKDFSMLFTYTSADRYLRDGGTLGFVITQEVFKSKGAGEGFRRFRLGDNGAYLKVFHMEDMVDLKPFHAANKTSIFLMKKGEETSYPVPVVEWRRNKGVGRIPPEWGLAQVRSQTSRKHLKAVPVDENRVVSSWQTAEAGELELSKRLKGKNPYLARLGARVEPYGVFWLKFIEMRPDGLVVIENQYDRGKRKVRHVRDALETKLIFPAVSGGDIIKFGIKDWFPILISQDPNKREPYPVEWMQENAPLTLAYLKQFEAVLLSRGSNVVRDLAKRTAFYAMFGIGDYSFARYRVVWKRMAQKMEATVLTSAKTPFGTKTLISTDTTSLITAVSKEEAHYICAILNSIVIDSYIRSFSSGGRGFGAPSIMKNIAIPPFNERNKLHLALVRASLEAHEAVARKQGLGDLENRINRLAKELWNIKD
jgi:hypothetical protein